MKRSSKRINPRSEKRIASASERDAMRVAVFERDGHCLLVNGFPGHRCQGPPTVHHLLKASAGGSYEESNLVLLCASANSWVEDWPSAAWDLGLVCRNGETLDECWTKLRAARLVP